MEAQGNKEPLVESTDAVEKMPSPRDESQNERQDADPRLQSSADAGQAASFWDQAGSMLAPAGGQKEEPAQNDEVDEEKGQSIAPAKFERISCSTWLRTAIIQLFSRLLLLFGLMWALGYFTGGLLNWAASDLMDIADEMGSKQPWI